MGCGKVEGGMKCIKWLIVLFNSIIVVVGLLLIICGALIMTKFEGYITVLGSSFNTAPTFIIVVGVVIFVVAFFGCCGAWKENHCMVMTFASLMVLLLILQLCAAIAGFVMKAKVRQVVTKPLKTALNGYSSKSQYRSVFDKIQRTLECCGVEKPADWKTHMPEIPLSCCKPLPANQNCTEAISYQKGCLDRFDTWIANNVLIVAAVAVAVCFVQLIGIVCACYLARAIHSGYNKV